MRGFPGVGGRGTGDENHFLRNCCRNSLFEKHGETELRVLTGITLSARKYLSGLSITSGLFRWCRLLDFSEALSLLYRRRFLQLTAHFAAFSKLYKLVQDYRYSIPDFANFVISSISFDREGNIFCVHKW